jgi:quercetin dioxygenase-like cupin family protein
LLILLAGEADLILPERKATRENEPPLRLRAHQFVYYPAGYPHTLVGASREPVHYLMVKWMSAPTGITEPLPFGTFSPFEPPTDAADAGCRPFQTHRLLKGHTQWLRRLRCHTTALASRAGYEPHADPYDVIILVLDGHVETLGKRLGPNGVIFYAAGEQHGIHNPGETMARYLVFEFHGRPSPPGTRGIAKQRRAAKQPRSREADPKKLKKRRSLWHKATDRERWSRRLNRWFGRRGPT